MRKSESFRQCQAGDFLLHALVSQQAFDKSKALFTACLSLFLAAGVPLSGRVVREIESLNLSPVYAPVSRRELHKSEIGSTF